MKPNRTRRATMRFQSFIILCIAISFLLNSYIFIRTSLHTYRDSVGQVLELALEGIYNRIADVFADPISLSNTMSRDLFLKEFLKEEEQGDEEYIRTVSQYLEGYHEGYDAVFLASAVTSRYYNFDGVDRMLAKENEEDVWFYEFLAGEQKYSLNIDNDEAAQDEITVFVNSRITEGDRTVGIIGVGFRIDMLHQLLENYEEEFEVSAYLVEADGTIQVASDQERELEQISLEEGTEGRIYRVNRYIPQLDWYLLVEKDMSPMLYQIENDISRVVVLFFIVTAVVCALITYMTRHYNRQIFQLVEQGERQRLSSEQQIDSQLYDAIHEVNITGDRPAGAATEAFFVRMGAPRGCSYSEALTIIAEKQLKKEYREGYIQTFGRENIMQEYEEGKQEIVYECMLRTGDEGYHWVRVVAHIYLWRADQTIRMYISREDIDKSKSRMLNH